MKNFIRFFAVSLLVAFSISISLGQDRDAIRSIAGSQYLISAKAGGVNLTIGEVSVQRRDSGSGYLVKGDTLEVGDRVATAAGAKTEILLNPGSYVRMGGNSEFEFVTTDLDDLQLKLNRGSAMFEVYASDDFRVTIIAPGSRFYLIKSGVYRVDAFENGTSRIEVRKGKAQVGDLDATSVKKSKAAIVDGDEVAVSKFDRDERDDLEDWSRGRSKDLAKANASLQRDNLRNSLWNGYRSSSWDTFNTYGLWTYSSSLGSYCFLPFGYGWRSPYGFGLNRDLYYFRLPPVVYYEPRVNRSRPTDGINNQTGATPGQENQDGTSRPSRSPNGRVYGVPPVDGVDTRERPSGQTRRANPSGQPRDNPPPTSPRGENPSFPRSFPQQPSRQVEVTNQPRREDSAPSPARVRSVPIDQ